MLSKESFFWGGDKKKQQNQTTPVNTSFGVRNAAL